MKYYSVDAFVIEADDMWGSWTTSDIARIRKDKIVTFIATKTLGGYREIKTGRFIRNADLRMHTTIKREHEREGHAYLDKRTVRELEKTGVAIVTCTHYGDELVRPVKDLEEVKSYLEEDIAKETFTKVDKLKKEGRVETKKARKKQRIQRMEDAKEAIEEFKESFTEKRAERAEKRQLNKDIKKEIKKRR